MRAPGCAISHVPATGYAVSRRVLNRTGFPWPKKKRLGGRSGIRWPAMWGRKAAGRLLTATLKVSSFRNSRVPIRIGSCPALFPFLAGRLIAPLKRFRGAIFVRAAGNAGAALEVPSDHRGGSRGRPRHHRSAPRTLDEALRLPGRLRARENGVYWRREGRDRGPKGIAHCGPVPGVDPRGGSTAQGCAPALRKAAPWMIERARTGYVVRGSAITERRKKKRTIGATVVGSLGCALARLGQDDYG